MYMAINKLGNLSHSFLTVKRQNINIYHIGHFEDVNEIPYIKLIAEVL